MGLPAHHPPQVASCPELSTKVVCPTLSSGSCGTEQFSFSAPRISEEVVDSPPVTSTTSLEEAVCSGVTGGGRLGGGHGALDWRAGLTGLPRVGSKAWSSLPLMLKFL